MEIIFDKNNDLINTGGEGSIYKVYDNTNDRIVAPKIIDKRFIYIDENLFFNVIEVEVNAMKLFEYEYSVKFYEYLQTKNSIIFVLVYCDTDLDEYLYIIEINLFKK